MQCKMTKEWESDGTTRGNPGRAEHPEPKAGTGLKWHCLTCRTRSREFVPTRPVCTSFPGAEPALSPQSHRAPSPSSAWARPVLRTSIPGLYSPSRLAARPLSVLLSPLWEPISPLLGPGVPSTAWSPQCMDSGGSDISHASPGMQVVTGVRGPDTGSQPCHSLAV